MEHSSQTACLHSALSYAAMSICPCSSSCTCVLLSTFLSRVSFSKNTNNNVLWLWTRKKQPLFILPATNWTSTIVVNTHTKYSKQLLFTESAATEVNRSLAVDTYTYHIYIYIYIYIYMISYIIYFIMTSDKTQMKLQTLQNTVICRLPILSSRLIERERERDLPSKKNNNF